MSLGTGRAGRLGTKRGGRCGARRTAALVVGVWHQLARIGGQPRLLGAQRRKVAARRREEDADLAPAGLRVRRRRQLLPRRVHHLGLLPAEVVAEEHHQLRRAVRVGASAQLAAQPLRKLGDGAVGERRVALEVVALGTRVVQVEHVRDDLRRAARRPPELEAALVAPHPLEVEVDAVEHDRVVARRGVHRRRRAAVAERVNLPADARPHAKRGVEEGVAGRQLLGHR